MSFIQTRVCNPDVKPRRISHPSLVRMKHQPKSKPQGAEQYCGKYGQIIQDYTTNINARILLATYARQPQKQFVEA